MKRIIVTICAVGASFGTACSSGPNGAVSPPDGDRTVSFNADQPPADGEDPFGNPDQPLGNPDQPALNSDTPSGGGSFDCTTFCTSFACLLDSSFSGNECISECEVALPTLSAEDLECLGAFTDVFACLESAGFDCNELRRLQEGDGPSSSINEGAIEQCQELAQRSASCIDDIGRNEVQVDIGRPPPSSGNDFYVCDDGQTQIPFDWICDGGTPDCEDGSDEAGC